MKKPPVAPPAYRPQPTPAVLQTKKDPLRKATTAKTVQPAKKKANAAPVAYKPQPTPRVLQTKMRDKHPPRASASSVRTRSSVVQRAQHSYTTGGIPKVETEGLVRFVSQNGLEYLVITDAGGRLKAFLNGQDIGYVTYEEETEEGQRRMRFGYIHVTDQTCQGKKVSACLLFALSLKAIERGIMLMCVGHPDPEKRAYWQAMGLDYHGGQVKQHNYYLNAPHYKGMEIPPVEETKPTEAVGPVRSVLQWSQGSFRAYWHLI